MEAEIDEFIKKWPLHAAWEKQTRPILVLSTSKLSASEINELRTDFVNACGESYLSCILSLKMMHIYFRVGNQTFDYRPHQGIFSRLVQSDYRLGETDRAEALIHLKPEELNHLRIYKKNITNCSRNVLGKPHPLQLREPDFAVRVHETQEKLHANSFCSEEAKHNCLTWLTTAPLGTQSEPVWKLLGMSLSDLKNQSHSYIIPFYQHLVTSAPLYRVPAIVIWSQSPLESVLSKIHQSPNFVEAFYGQA